MAKRFVVCMFMWKSGTLAYKIKSDAWNKPCLNHDNLSKIAMVSPLDFTLCNARRFCSSIRKVPGY